MISERGNTAQRVEQILKPLLDERGMELVDIDFKSEGKSRLLRVFIDKEGGITVDDCADISRELSAVLDVNEIINSSYRLEISSPGLRRPLKKPADFLRFTGKKVKIRTFSPVSDRKTFVGELLGIEEGQVFVEVDGVKYTIPSEKISKANLEIEF